jgi:phospholipid/cholesterol/gamma-HCH transport system substrate-binding protein
VRNDSLADAMTVLPTFLRETRLTVNRLTPFARNTNPLVSQLRPAARQLSPTLIDLAGFAPDLEALFRDLRPLIRAARSGFPALEETLGDARPLLEQLDPFLRQVIPISDYLGLFKRETSAFFANVPASTQATDRPPGAGGPVHYLRLLQVLRPEDLAAYPTLPSSSRLNPYPQPGSLSSLPSGLDVFGGYLCKAPGNSAPPLSAALISQLNAADPTLVPNILKYAYGGSPSNVPTPACRAQTPLGRTVGQPGAYPHLNPSP